MAVTGCGSASATRTVTVRAAAPPPVVKTIVKWRTPKTITKRERVEVPAASETTPSAATPDCNDLPPAASADLTQIRESRCEMEKLNTENPSTANEHEIETMISSERSIEATER
ncbi:MAG: hypothetical protein ACRDK7_11950 [Solirubrobacteraceae bacterium]